MGTYYEPGTVPDTFQVVLLYLPENCKTSMVIPILQIRRLRLIEIKELLARMSEPGSNSCVCWTPDPVFPAPGQERGQDSSSFLGVGDGRDILSFQERQVIGQRAHVVMSFSGRG